MTGWLLDTNVVSELRRPRPEPKMIAFVAHKALASLFISVVTLAEIRFGIEILVDATRRSELEIWLANRVRPMFAGRVLPISEDVLLKWRLLVAEGSKIRHTYTQPDLFIAATALHHGLTVVTRDAEEFAHAGADVVDPWL